MRPRTSSAIDGESLQADVMRFMAIIAFCLVAIMALVRDVAPPTRAEAVEIVDTVVQEEVVETVEPVELAVATADAPQPVAKPQPQAVPVKVTPIRVPAAAHRVVIAEPGQREVDPIHLQKPVPREPAKPAIAKTEPSRADQLRAQLAALTTTAEPMAQPSADPATQAPVLAAALQESAEPAPESPPEPGLSLRFNSDSDFLRLISKGDVAVFLFQSSEPRRLSSEPRGNTEQWLKLGANYAFSSTPPPQEIYELLPATIPRAIQASAASAVGDVAGWQWGVAMPGRIQSRIEELVGIARNGQLVIDRFGEVEHLPPLSSRRAEG